MLWMNTKFEVNAETGVTEKDVKRVCLLYYFQIFEQNLKTKSHYLTSYVILRFSSISRSPNTDQCCTTDNESYDYISCV